MALVVPFLRREGGRVPQALTEDRLKTIAGMELALKTMRDDAYGDLAAGMPYLGTQLRLAPRFETRFSVLNGDVSEQRSTGS